MSLSYMRRESKYRKKVHVSFFPISSPFSCLDKEAVWEGRQGGRGQAGQGPVVQGAQQGGLPDLHVRSRFYES